MELKDWWTPKISLMCSGECSGVFKAVECDGMSFRTIGDDLKALERRAHNLLNLETEVRLATAQR